MKRHHWFAPAAIVALLGFVSASSAANNTLTPDEKAAGWQLLFDGRTLDGWANFRSPGTPIKGWEVVNGTLRTVAGVRGGSQLVTRNRFDDFEFSWEWRMRPGGNNGIKYFVNAARPSAPGHEYQLLDDPAHPKVKPDQLTAAFYDVLPAAENKPLRPAGEWNRSRIVVRGNHVEHWLNGRNVLTYQLGSAEVQQGIANSKFKDEPGFGEKITAPIMLTYHRDECWFRNLKIRTLE